LGSGNGCRFQSLKKRENRLACAGSCCGEFEARQPISDNVSLTEMLSSELALP
jgi:hypothetical protein